MSGLLAQSFALENISGNIANSQTVGFKRTDTSFADLLTGGSFNIRNQVSGSVAAFSRQTNDLQGSLVTSSSGTSIGIKGSGFLLVESQTGEADGKPLFGGGDLYTRRGDFEIDKNGFLVNGAGYYLKGQRIDALTGNPVGSSNEIIQIGQEIYPAVATKTINYETNLPTIPQPGNYEAGDPTSWLLDGSIGGTVTGDQSEAFLDSTIAGDSITVYDEKGGAHDLQIRWGKVSNGDPAAVPPTLALPLFTDAGSPYSGSLDGAGQRLGFAGRISVNAVLVIAERKLADLGADGRGRIDLSAVSGSSFTVSQEASGPFGFKITSLNSTLENGVAIGPSGTPPSITLGVSGQTQVGGQIRVGLTLPDGSTEEIALTAKAADDASALAEGEFRIGATTAETAANMHAAFDAALEARAATDLTAASAVQAGEAFLNAPAGSEPARVAGFDGTYANDAARVAALQSATALDTIGTAEKTVSWYVGETASDDPRKTAGATVADGVTVAYGARADEDGPRRVIQTLAVFSTMTFSADDAEGRARYAALAERTVSALGSADATRDIRAATVDLATAATAIKSANERHSVAKGMAEDSLSVVEGVSKEDVSLRILALQTQLPASYQVTANLSQLSLVNFL